MMSKAVLIPFLLFFVLLVSPVCVVSVYALNNESKLNKTVYWLQSSMYVPSLGLCREAPNYFPNRVWVLNDNGLVVKALKTRLSGLSNAIDHKLRTEYRDYIGLGLPIDVILYDRAVSSFEMSESVTVKMVGDYEIKSEVLKGSVWSDWDTYANLLLVHTLSDFYGGNSIAVGENYKKVCDMWNGTGFVDKSVGDKFGTYVNALFLYVTYKINASCSFLADVESKVWGAYDDATGGFKTDYNNVEFFGDVNVETACFVLLAFERPFKLEFPYYLAPEFLLGAFFVAIIFRRLK